MVKVEYNPLRLTHPLTMILVLVLVLLVVLVLVMVMNVIAKKRMVMMTWAW